MPFKRKGFTHVVFKIEDAKKYLTKRDFQDLYNILNNLEIRRLREGKKINNYYVVNTDEPYAPKVFEVIKQGEIAKEDNDV